jgi:hypothetical protein
VLSYGLDGKWKIFNGGWRMPGYMILVSMGRNTLGIMGEQGEITL